MTETDLQVLDDLTSLHRRIRQARSQHRGTASRPNVMTIGQAVREYLAVWVAYHRRRRARP